MIKGIKIQHVSVIILDTSAALEFYVDVLKFEIDPQRPDLGYPGAWLQVNTQQQIHLLELPNPDPIICRPEHGGRDRHVAFHVDDLSHVENALIKAGLDFTLSKSGRKALFCRDPDGNALEFIEA